MSSVLLFFPIVSRHMLIPAAALILICAALLMVFGPQRIDHLHEQRVFHIPFGLIRCTMRSLIGYIIYMADKQFIQQRRYGAWLDIVQVSFIALFVVLMATPLSDVGRLGAIALSALLVLVFAHEGRVVTSVLSMRGCRILGHLSYGVYLVHVPLLWLFVQHGLLPGGNILQTALLKGNAQPYYKSLAIFYISVFAVAFILYVTIECPAKRLILRALDRYHHVKSEAPLQRAASSAVSAQ